MAKRAKKAQTAAEKRKAIEQYEHTDKKRMNNPPVGLVTPQTDPEPKKKTAWRYDPHLDPELGFDPQGVRQRVERLIADGLADPGGSAVPSASAKKKSANYTLAEGMLRDEIAALKARLTERETSLTRARTALEAIGSMQAPYLNWAGKAERTSFEVPVVSLHVHERIDPKTIIEAVRARNGGDKNQLPLFELPAENPPLRDAIDFYQHEHNWSNRLIAGDSLLVMNSLLEKEGMAGKVQMIYIDPPYGIRYGSNFQPFVNNRQLSESDADEDLTAEPETLRAFRDTWELGVHSYLAYLRDRFLLARELLADSGSIFVQISDENLHLVRDLLDEVFGARCLVVTIPVKKKGSQKSGLMDPVNDYLVWYSKTPRSDKGELLIRFHKLFRRREIDPDTLSVYKFVELGDRAYDISAVPGPNGEPLDYRLAPRRLLEDYPNARLFKSENLTSGGERKNQSLPYRFAGHVYTPRKGTCWKTTAIGDDGGTSGMARLEWGGRIIGGKGQLRYKGYLDDFGYIGLSNWWDSLGGAAEPIYVVQTNPEILERCILMTTDPGDLVLDPTCGSGTTAYVAEQWGRRWITCDTSRVAITLAKQRLMSATFDYYKLAHESEGIASGFEYKRVKHVTLKSIANNPEIKEGMSRQAIDAAIDRYADRETLYDRPEIDNNRARVTGPFTVEAVPAAVVHPLEDASPHTATAADRSVARAGETLRQDQWRDELLRTGVRGKGGEMLQFARVELLAGARYLHCLAETKGKPQRVAVSFGPEYAPLEQRQVEEAWEEARTLAPKPDILLFAAFQFDPEAAKDIDHLDPAKAGMLFLKAQMNADLLTEDLKKKRASNESFWLIGQPDVLVRKIHRGEDAGMWEVEVQGFDYYNPISGKIESGGPEKIAVWLLDADYDGRSLYPRQVFFPLAGEKDGWAKLARDLKAEIDQDAIEAYRGTVSLPFELGKHRRVAVKIVDDRGIESLKVVDIERAPK